MFKNIFKSRTPIEASEVRLSNEILMLAPLDLKWILSRCELFIRHQISLAKADGVIIGLSGGIDSSTTVAICERALGCDKVFVLLMPENTSNPKDLEHGLKVTNQFNIPYEIIDITKIIDRVKDESSKGTPLNLPILGNIKARTRMLLLYTIANSKNYLVVGSSNKSELLTGYFTKYGDGGSDLLPLGDLYKTGVRQLGEYLKIPQEIIDKPPSAGLWPGQTDEDELGIQYTMLDKILWGLEHLMAPEDIAVQLEIPLETVSHVQKLIRTTDHKRRGPFVLKMGYRTPTQDWI